MSGHEGDVEGAVWVLFGLFGAGHPVAFDPGKIRCNIEAVKFSDHSLDHCIHVGGFR